MPDSSPPPAPSPATTSETMRVTMCICGVMTQGHRDPNPDCPMHPAPIYDDGGGLLFRFAHGRFESRCFDLPWRPYSTVTGILGSLARLEGASALSQQEGGALQRVRGMAALLNPGAGYLTWSDVNGPHT